MVVLSCRQHTYYKLILKYFDICCTLVLLDRTVVDVEPHFCNICITHSSIFVCQARVERMEDFKKKGEDINKGLQECRRKLAEAQKKVRELSISAAGDAKAELTKTQTEEKKLKKEEREWAKKLDEHNHEEKKMPWNVDTLSKDGFSKVSKCVAN